MSKKEIASRAIKTFVEAAVSYLVAALAGVNFAEDNLQKVFICIGISAVAAGVSGVWNGIIEPLLKTSVEEEDDGSIV